ncbi:MAG: hypothetical protein P9E88_07755 [Candidatus Competibacter sp.]|nr:hypothetical protein [Candidatus Competibacter sp.]
MASNAPYEVSTNSLCIPSYDRRADSIGDTLSNVANCLSLVLHALRDDAEALEFGRAGLVLLLDLVIDAVNFAKSVATEHDSAAGEIVIALAATEFERLRECAAGGPVDELAAAIIRDSLAKLQPERLS